MFAREGVFALIDTTRLPLPARAAVRAARLIERPASSVAANRLATALTRLGPSYVKLGQFLATRPDVVGVPLARDLETLQDKMAPFPQAEAEAAVEAALGKPLRDLFAAFGPPVAAASIAQVHRAEVAAERGRRPVAVKVLRPSVERRFKVDLDAFTFAARTDRAEAMLQRALERKAIPFRIDAGGGAFYGPKIDIKFRDAIGRLWQGPTIQLDFNLPERFELSYTGPDNARTGR